MQIKILNWFQVVYNKKKYDISFGVEETVGALKAHLQDVIGVPSTMQKVMIKGKIVQWKTLKNIQSMSSRLFSIKKGSGMLVIKKYLHIWNKKLGSNTISLENSSFWLSKFTLRLPNFIMRLPIFGLAPKTWSK